MDDPLHKTQQELLEEEIARQQREFEEVNPNNNEPVDIDPGVNVNITNISNVPDSLPDDEEEEDLIINNG
jgi:hypothetical protein